MKTFPDFRQVIEEKPQITSNDDLDEAMIYAQESSSDAPEIDFNSMDEEFIIAKKLEEKKTKATVPPQKITTQPSTTAKVIPLKESQRFTRESVEKDSEYMYLFTDNAKRTSGSQLVADESRYSAVYGGGKKYPTSTQAVIRGLDNAFPITTMVDDKRTQWTDDRFEEFKQEIDSEIAIIKSNMPNFKGIKFSAEMPFGKGAISNMKNTAPNSWNYLNTKLAELGIDNTGSIPKTMQPIIPSDMSNLEDTDFEVTKCRED